MLSVTKDFLGAGGKVQSRDRKLVQFFLTCSLYVADFLNILFIHDAGGTNMFHLHGTVEACPAEKCVYSTKPSSCCDRKLSF